MIESESKLCVSNLDKLKRLVDELETKEEGEGYQHTLKEIEGVIKYENKIIKSLKKPENKLKHYESVCATILSLLATVKL